MGHYNSEWNKEKHGRDIIPVLEDEFQGNERAFNDMVQEKEEDAESNKRSFTGGKYCIANDKANEQDSRQGCPGIKEGSRYLNIVKHGQAIAHRVKQKRDIKDNHPWFCQQSLSKGKRSIAVTFKKGKGIPVNKSEHNQGQNEEHNDSCVFL